MRDSAEVVGAAWQAKVDGAGYRRLAAKLGRPEPAVRRWLRRLASRAGALRAAATGWLYQSATRLPPGLPPPLGSGSLAPPARPQGRLGAAGVGTGGFRQLRGPRPALRAVAGGRSAAAT
jgi:hypothetical protein